MLTMHRRLHDGYAPTNVQATTPRAAGERRCDPSDALVSAPELRPPFRHITVLASVRGTPDPQWRMTRGVLDVSVDGEHLQVVTEAQAHEEGIDGPELHALAPAPVSDVGSRNVIVATRDDHREHREALQQVLADRQVRRRVRRLAHSIAQFHQPPTPYVCGHAKRRGHTTEATTVSWSAVPLTRQPCGLPSQG